jgi:hypothetical protein
MKCKMKIKLEMKESTTSARDDKNENNVIQKFNCRRF